MDHPSSGLESRNSFDSSIFENFIKVTLTRLEESQNPLIGFDKLYNIYLSIINIQNGGKKDYQLLELFLLFEDLIFFPKLAVAKLNYLWNDRIE